MIENKKIEYDKLSNIENLLKIDNKRLKDEAFNANILNEYAKYITVLNDFFDFLHSWVCK